MLLWTWALNCRPPSFSLGSEVRVIWNRCGRGDRVEPMPGNGSVVCVLPWLTSLWAPWTLPVSAKPPPLGALAADLAPSLASFPGTDLWLLSRAAGSPWRSIHQPAGPAVARVGFGDMDLFLILSGCLFSLRPFKGLHLAHDEMLLGDAPTKTQGDCLLRRTWPPK